MVNIQSELRGLFAAIITPMDNNEEINLKSLNALVEYELSQGVEGFYVNGSSGEGLLLSLKERMAVAETVLKAVKGQKTVIIHTGTIRTADVITMAQHAKENGASAVSMIPPYYYSFSPEEVTDYYLDVIKQVEIPVILYNIPAFTGVVFNKQNSKKLLSNSQIIGIKHTSHNLYDMERFRDAYPEKIIFNGYDEIFLSGLAAGADAAIGTTINLFAKKFIAIRENFLAGNMLEAMRLQNIINSCVEGFVDVGIFNAVKYALSTLGIESGSCRKPFKTLTEEQKENVKKLLHLGLE